MVCYMYEVLLESSNNHTKKINLLKCCSSLAKYNEHENVYISPDRTKRRQLADYKLRQELCRIRDTGQMDFYTRRGQLQRSRKTFLRLKGNQRRCNSCSCTQL